jgi:hypothetical protein
MIDTFLPLQSGGGALITAFFAIVFILVYYFWMGPSLERAQAELPIDDNSSHGSKDTQPSADLSRKTGGLSSLKKKTATKRKPKPEPEPEPEPDYDLSSKVDRDPYDNRRNRPNRMSFDDKDDKHTEDLPDPNEIF